MANILADAYNKAMNEEGEKMDKQRSEAPEVNPSPNNVETDATVKAKALCKAAAEVEVEARVKPGPEVIPATSPKNVETNASLNSMALSEAEAEVEVPGQEVDQTTSPNDVETDATVKAKELSPATAEVEVPAPAGPGPGPRGEVKASGRREKGCCGVARCKHSKMELLHKCLTCKKYIHIVCSIDNKLEGEADCFYCSPSCAGKDTTTGTTGQDWLLVMNPGTEGKAHDVDPTTAESNQKASRKEDDAVARSESLSKAMTDPLTSDDPKRAQSSIEDLEKKYEGKCRFH
jgi:hypothetical protein